MTRRPSVKLLNSAGKDLQGSGMAKIAAAIDPMPEIILSRLRTSWD